MAPSPDIVIIGSGIGGATIASALAGADASVLVLERGHHLPDTPHTRDARSIFVEGHYRPGEKWFDHTGTPFSPGNYYYVGGNSKFYGAVLYRYRAEDFLQTRHFGGVSPAWPFDYDELEPWYSRAEALYQVRGSLGQDPTEPHHSKPYPHGPLADEPDIADVRERLASVGLSPSSLPLGVDIDRWLARAKTPWDAFPDTRCGKMDAETCGLAKALQSDNVTLVTGAMVETLETSPDGRTIVAVNARLEGEHRRITPKLVILSAGAVNSAALLLRSANGAMTNGLANRSGQVGRNFMNHNTMAMMAIDPRRKNRAIYQKTLGLNDFYLGDGIGGRPLGNVQLLGKISGTILKANIKVAPQFILNAMAAHSVDWYLMTEDLPNRDSRVCINGDKIVLHWQRSNLEALTRLEKTMRNRFRAAGYPIVLTRAFDKRTPSHQCGTVVMGDDPATAALDPWCRSWDHENLYVVDASFLPTSAAVNPALTIAAQALRVGDHIRKQVLQ